MINFIRTTIKRIIVHRKLRSYGRLSRTEKKEVLRWEAEEFAEKYGAAIKTLSTE